MQPDCRPPARYFSGSITVNPGGLQYNALRAMMLIQITFTASDNYDKMGLTHSDLQNIHSFMRQPHFTLEISISLFFKN